MAWRCAGADRVTHSWLERSTYLTISNGRRLIAKYQLSGNPQRYPQMWMGDHHLVTMTSSERLENNPDWLAAGVASTKAVAVLT